MDEGGVFESLKAEAASPPALFSGLSGLPAGSLPAAPFPSSLVLGASASGGDVFIQMPASREEGGGRGEGGTYHHRPPHHHFHHGGHRGSSLLQHVGGDHRAHADEAGDEHPGTPAPALSELKAVVCWLQKGLPFILILLTKLCFQHKLGESPGHGGFQLRVGGSPSQMPGKGGGGPHHAVRVWDSESDLGSNPGRLAVCLQASHSPSLSLCFLICPVGGCDRSSLAGWLV